jgi:uncharacterized SAM-binding protein YcdF (DUF218 family)
MYIILLGGSNNKNGKLSNSTIMRLNKFFEVYEQNKILNPKIIISGGFRFSEVSHCELIKNEILQKYPNILIEKEFIENNNTIDEAINISEFLSLNYTGNVIIITSSYHMNRVKYLFNKTFEKIKNIEIEFIETSENNNDDNINEEKDKLQQLVKNPYGKWLEYITYN